MENIPYHKHNKIDSPPVNYRDLEGAPTAAWELVDFEAVTTGENAITISGLDLEADKQYEIYVRNTSAVANAGAPSNLQVQFNGVTTNSYYSLTQWAQSHAVVTTGATGYTGVSGIVMTNANTGNGYVWFHACMRLTRLNGEPNCEWTFSGVDNVASLSITQPNVVPDTWILQLTLRH